jgi:hypothetical protein
MDKHLLMVTTGDELTSMFVFSELFSAIAD